MYAYPERKGPFPYFKIVATLENGSSIIIPTRDFSPALLPNARYILARVFRSTRRSKIFDEFLAAYIQRRNRSLAFGSPISSMEVQRWQWNYVVDPNDPRFGSLTGVYPYDVRSKPPPSH
jgi:hypothetical protein